MVMRILAYVLGATAVAGSLGSMVGCNAVLGINGASLEPVDDAGGPNDAGADVIELSCDHYCDVIMQNCTGANAEYLSRPICMQMCPAFDINSTVADTADDTLGCRLFHANGAANTPEMSCRFAGPLGGGHCGSDPCVPFCALDVQYCSFPKPIPYEGGTPDCEQSCGTYPYLVVDAGDTTTEGSNTLNCRLWHLETAFTSPDYGLAHCLHTALASMVCK
jgi:hypothetical protein